MSLSILPAELLLRVCEFLDPGWHLNLALVNRQLANNSQPFLERHRQCRKDIYTWSNYHDSDLALSPRSSGVADILRRVAFDPIAAWHVRGLDIWNDQSTPTRHEEMNLEAFDGASSSATHTIHRGSKVFAENLLAHNKLSTFGFKPPFAEGSIIDGDCEVQQVALIALCPRLVSFKVNSLRMDTIENEGVDPHSLTQTQQRSGSRYHTYLCDMILAVFQMPQPLWPPGFLSLRKLSLGTDRGNEDAHIVFQCVGILPVLLLPNLETISLRGLRLEDSEEEDKDLGYSLPPNSFSVKDILFSNIGSEGIKRVVWNVIESAKALSTIIFGRCDFNDFDCTVQQLWKHASTLETFIFCSAGQPSGYLCSTFRPEELRGDFKKLKILALDMEDVRLDSMYHYDSGPEEDGLTGNVASYENFVKYFNEDMIPQSIAKSLEILVFQHGSYSDLNTKDEEAIDDALVPFLVGHYPNLKCVFLDRVELASVKNASSEAGIHSPFLQAAMIGREQGITVYTDAESTDRRILEIIDKIFNFSPAPPGTMEV